MWHRYLYRLLRVLYVARARNRVSPRRPDRRRDERYLNTGWL